jgi:para-nitrobenzyl esterase
MLLALFGCSGNSGSASTTIATVKGLVTGIEENGAFAFKGIPYAAPPVGANRWKPPQPVPAWDNALDTTSFAAQCIQPEVASSEDASSVPPRAIGDEDCLYLNVWTPASAQSDSGLPVMFFIHGGANLFGSASESIDFILNTMSGASWYDGSRLAANGNVIVVTLNYRLGALGFLAHSAMLAESETGSVGNYGILDQVAALQWVQRNITQFGGDPARVMIFGQSAGAYDVCTLIASPLATGLFSRAMMESGSCSIHTAEMAQTNAEAVVEEVGCSGAADLLSCMRSVPADELALAQSAQPKSLGSFSMFPAVDGYVVSGNPIDIIQSGAHNHVPVIIGSNSDEYVHRIKDVSALDYPSIISDLVGIANVGQVLSLYPLSDYSTPSEAVATVYADRNITCPAGWYAGVMAFAQTAPVYRYFFKRTLAGDERLADGAYHSSELLYVFQHMNNLNFYADDNDRLVESIVRGYWTAFAAHGDPNTRDYPFWPKFDNLNESYQAIDVITLSQNYLNKQKCDMWASML